MAISDLLIRRKKTVILIWVIVLVASTPAILGYSHFISYNTSSSTTANTESAVASRIISNSLPQNESLIIVISGNPYASTGIANSTLKMELAISTAGISNITGSDSPFSAYSTYIDNILNGSSAEIRSVYSAMQNASNAVFSFPSSFLAAWASYDFNSSLIYTAAQDAGFNGSSYESAFISEVNYSAQPAGIASATNVVQNAINISAGILYNGTPFAYTVSHDLGVLNYSSKLPFIVSNFISQITGFKFSAQLVVAAVNSSNPGYFYVTNYGLLDIPPFISKQYISGDNSTFIVNVNFDTPSTYQESNGSTPSQTATPILEGIASTYFGKNASLTGEGAISYQTQQLTSSSGIAFAFIFIILAIAVFITLVSYKASIAAILLVSVATALGYVAIFLTGLIFHSVDYVVNYTLTAVILGVATDYLVFIFARYRQELREGKPNDEALMNATSKAGRAVFISGLAVAVSLGMFSLVPGFRTWGLVLFLAILFTVILEVTLVPGIMKILGPKLFMKRSMRPLEEGYQKKAFYYRAAKFSIRKRIAVLATVFVLALPASYLFFTLPTTYNFNTGLPEDLSSVKALNTLEQKFGSNLLYPVIILVPLNGQATSNNISISNVATISQASNYINGTAGVSSILGPFHGSSGSNSSISGYVIDKGKYAYFLAYTDYNPYSPQAEKVVKDLRENSNLIVGGVTSSVIDQKAQNSRNYTELAILIIASIAVIMCVSFRSLKYPVISLSGVFISIAWTTAILFLLTTYVLHEALIYLIPVILFVILMSLGNDYSVFIISRIREEETKNSADEGIAYGMVGSGKVVTSLGLILAASLGSLAFIPVGFLQQLGIAFIISLVLDTFVIRTLYFPALLSFFTSKKTLDPEGKLAKD